MIAVFGYRSFIWEVEVHQKHLVIIGAGPIGLEAAVQASEAGFKVSLFEKSGIAQNIQDWGHVKLFTPFGMNTSSGGIQLLTESAATLPSSDALLSGREFAEVYLKPLADLLRKRIAVHENSQIVAISRGDLLKGEAIGSRAAQHSKFRLLVEQNQRESVVSADLIFDCTGVYPHHNWLGTGGIPCPGERCLSKQIEYSLPDLKGPAAKKYHEKTTLVVGSGYSAASTICELATIAKQSPGTKIHWATRSADSQGPISRMDEDQLAGRDELARQANRLATDYDDAIQWHRGCVVEHLQPHAGNGNIVATLRSLNEPASESTQIEVGQIIAQVGYRPDRSLHEELQIHECYATSGPIKLAAFLLGQQAADCLSVSACEAETLKNPEPDYYLLGSKSYGRNTQFLMQTGYEHITKIIAELVALPSSLSPLV